MIRFFDYLLFEKMFYIFMPFISGSKKLCFACVLQYMYYFGAGNKDCPRLHAVLFIRSEAEGKGNIFGELLHAYVIVC